MHKNKLQEHLNQENPLTEAFAASFLATKGKEFNEELEEAYEEHSNGLPTTRLFTISIIESLFLGRFIIYSKLTFQRAFDFFANDNTVIFDNLAKIRGQNIELEHLQNLLISWKRILKGLGSETLIASAPANEILDYQHQVLEEAQRLSYTKTGLRGLGAWTLLAPFKVIIVSRKDLWKDENTDRILLPLGSQVVNGLKFLNKKFPVECYKAAKAKGNLQSNLENIKVVQEFEGELARVANNSRVVHINSGLFLLGKGDGV